LPQRQARHVDTDVGRQAITPTRYSLDQPAVAEGLAQQRHLHLQVVVLDHRAGPHLAEQLVLADHPALGPDQRGQHLERPPAQRDRLAVKKGFSPLQRHLGIAYSDHGFLARAWAIAQPRAA